MSNTYFVNISITYLVTTVHHARFTNISAVRWAAAPPRNINQLTVLLVQKSENAKQKLRTDTMVKKIYIQNWV